MQSCWPRFYPWFPEIKAQKCEKSVSHIWTRPCWLGGTFSGRIQTGLEKGSVILSGLIQAGLAKGSDILNWRIQTGLAYCRLRRLIQMSLADRFTYCRISWLIQRSLADRFTYCRLSWLIQMSLADRFILDEETDSDVFSWRILGWPALLAV